MPDNHPESTVILPDVPPGTVRYFVAVDRIQPDGRKLLGIPISAALPSADEARSILSAVIGRHPYSYCIEVRTFR